ncbi:protoporphyrinogen oxidase isoform X1 [Erpetoichthys calabaricus]|uniref:Protoporphyrinogen oxidase n=1 Tax=Erpetoichthys calabaricus TaxID=27687 RepID=A0A8C4XFW6_ERPCA|nr:protoporphyrinogen oxidase isoform X1 [Erpetoichthys calabaricus]XP_051776770.1 protoporphyrinogen oxidase isoform X1 [Erpetoichthys calabaricus]
MQKTVVVIGGGISGLSTCYYLSKNSQSSKIILLEANKRLGGWMHTIRREDGAVFEQGPRAIRPAGVIGRNTLKMVSELGLENEILPVTAENPASRNRFLFVNGKLQKLPSSPVAALKATPPFSKSIFHSILEEIFVKRGTLDDESVHGFVERRLGKELADIAIDSLCRGVFAGDCRKLSMRSCFPPLFHAERKHGSITLGMVLGARMKEESDVKQNRLVQQSRKEHWSQWSLKQGLQTLAESLEDHLRNTDRVEIHQEAAVQQIQMGREGAWEVHVEGGRFKADYIVSAVQAKVLSSMLPPAAQPLAEELQKISPASVAVVNLEYDGLVLPVTGFGHLIPSTENRAVLGIVYDSDAFPEHNRKGPPSTRLTVMMGGAWFTEEFGSPEEADRTRLLHVAVQAVKSHLNVKEMPSWSNVNVHKDCIPQYLVGHWKCLDNIWSLIEQHRLPLSLVGASYEGVSVNDCIFGGKRAAERLLGN